MGCASSIAAAALAPPRAPPVSLAEAATQQRRASLNTADLHHQHSALLLSADGGQWRDRWREEAKKSSLKGSLKGSSRSFEGSIKGSSRSFETADNRRGSPRLIDPESLRAGNDREGSSLSGLQARALADNTGTGRSSKGSSRSFEPAAPRRSSFGVGNAREGSPLSGSQASGTDSSRIIMPPPNV